MFNWILRLLRKGFATVVILFFCLWGADLEAKGCESVLKRLSSATAVAMLCAAGTFFSGCAATDQVMARPGDYLNEHLLLKQKIESQLGEKMYRWALHIHFEPHDFGGVRSYYAGLTRQKAAQLRGALGGQGLKDEKGSFLFDEEWRPQWIVLEPSDPSFFLGSISFYYNQSERALEFLENLFESPETILSQTLLIVSGGSHGVHEAKKFIQGLDNRFGEEPEILIFADGITQPLFFPVISAERPEGSVALNFFQKNDPWLKGSSIEGFYNIRTENLDHHQLAIEAWPMARRLILQLRLTSEGVRYGPEESPRSGGGFWSFLKKPLKRFTKQN